MSAPTLNRLCSFRMLNSCVLVCGYSSPESGIGAVHVAGHRVRHHLALGAVLGPLRDRVREILADHALEDLSVLGSVEVTEHVVQRPILEQHHDHVIHRVPSINGHTPTSPFMIAVTWVDAIGRRAMRPAPWLWRAARFRSLAHHQSRGVLVTDQCSCVRSCTYLDLHDAIHIGHSTGGGEVARYVARHQDRVAKAVLVASLTPNMVQSETNPGGQPQ